MRKTSNSKRFVCLIFGFFSMGLVLLWAIAWLVPERMYMPSGYGVFMWQKDYVHMDGNRREILFLGDSGVKCDIVPEIVHENAVNLALGGSSPVEMYITLEHYLAHHPAPRLVLVGFMANHFEQLGAYKYETFLYRYFSKEMALQTQEQVFICDHTPWMDRLKRIVQIHSFYLRTPLAYGQYILRSVLNWSAAGNAYKAADEQRGWQRLAAYENMDGHSGENMEAKQEKFKLLPSSDFYMRKLLTLCKSRDIPVHVVQLPVNKTSYAIIEDNGYLSDYNAYMRKLAEETGVGVDFDIPCYDDRCFADPDHCNRIGTERFSQEVREKCRKLAPEMFE